MMKGYWIYSKDIRWNIRTWLITKVIFLWYIEWEKGKILERKVIWLSNNFPTWYLIKEKENEIVEKYLADLDKKIRSTSDNGV
jgi:hypothetical protein